MKYFLHSKIRSGKVLIITFILFYGLGLPHSVKAQAAVPCPWGFLEVLDVDGVRDICSIIGGSGATATTAIGRLLSWVTLSLTALVMMAAAVGIVIGGYIYMTAGGSADRVQLAKTWIIAALLGITIALTAFVLLNTISTTLV
ncbi:MAG: hypothetical protein A3E37_00890 [Candidatus Andersenbacteria bacterium RIFCSPHIGHO2_12_FULL_46_9]|nr:MAG: hypothetical protein UW94_C0001G0106 [Parcubacteria group bacterium GW2011_GWA2_45_14]OGY35751.1 MAG: hypothetical protein A3B76_03500 [Candidatus Andersenbacteria bacterium RIFCSPHIGHO2_02_FULL_46_16]OGY37482.1 MAG: hypothetical protein A3I08_00420 [Candidatus Andersenbacteria bacterium RIFCSPLOWO2_02_FULL_46_11]OGY37964.1 MAG: hypothetical protein A3E37_00890 [Candidatus Andersenbacteria bacterium RIFCSPHIGHO2_12_FULL_46_9]OGY39648.1 MAG: hypothetical protein A3G57_04690 [Candidatus A